VAGYGARLPGDGKLNAVIGESGVYPAVHALDEHHQKDGRHQDPVDGHEEIDALPGGRSSATSRWK
jgi:hypothetical protein